MPSLQEFLGAPSVEENQGRTDEDRLGESVGESSDIRLCACGCGAALSPTSHGNVKYRPGHKLKDAKVSKDPDRPAKPADNKVPTFPGDVLPASVKKDIEEKCEFFLTILGMAWESKDPICGGEFATRSDQISQKLVPLIAKNPFLLKFFTSSGQMSAALELAIVLWPIGKTVAQHHVFKTIGHDEELPTVPNNNLYPVR